MRERGKLSPSTIPRQQTELPSPSEPTWLLSLSKHANAVAQDATGPCEAPIEKSVLMSVPKGSGTVVVKTGIVLLCSKQRPKTTVMAAQQAHEGSSLAVRVFRSRSSELTAQRSHGASRNLCE